MYGIHRRAIACSFTCGVFASIAVVHAYNGSYGGMTMAGIVAFVAGMLSVAALEDEDTERADV
jgi:hypothetical protein